MYGCGRFRTGLTLTPLFWDPQFFFRNGFWVLLTEKLLAYNAAFGHDEDLLYLEGPTEDCFCKLCFLFSLRNTELCFWFGAEPVELLLDKNCKDWRKFLPRSVSKLRLLLLLNCQKDLLAGGLSSSSVSKLTARSSFSRFFSAFEFSVLEFWLGTVEGRGWLGQWWEHFGEDGIFFLIWIGRIFPLEKSSSAEDSSKVRLLTMLKLKSELESKSARSDRCGWSVDAVAVFVWLRSWENEILGLIGKLEISEQISIAMASICLSTIPLKEPGNTFRILYIKNGTRFGVKRHEKSREEIIWIMGIRSQK